MKVLDYNDFKIFDYQNEGNEEYLGDILVRITKYKDIRIKDVCEIGIVIQTFDGNIDDDICRTDTWGMSVYNKNEINSDYTDKIRLATLKDIMQAQDITDDYKKKIIEYIDGTELLVSDIKYKLFEEYVETYSNLILSYTNIEKLYALCKHLNSTLNDVNYFKEKGNGFEIYNEKYMVLDDDEADKEHIREIDRELDEIYFEYIDDKSIRNFFESHFDYDKYYRDCKIEGRGRLAYQNGVEYYEKANDNGYYIYRLD